MAKITVEECADLDVRILQRMGVFAPASEGKLFPYRWYDKRTKTECSSIQLAHILDRAGGDWLVLGYSTKQTSQPASEYQQHTITIPVLYTDMPRGGRRRWLACPDCGGRAAVLYIMLQGYKYSPACRRCLDLAYLVQYQHQPRIPKSWQRKFDYFDLDAIQDVLNYRAFNDWASGAKWYKRLMQQQIDEARAARRNVAGGLGLQAGDELPAPAAPPKEKRGRGRPKTKRKYTRRSLVSAAADVVQPCCEHCGQPLPLDAGRPASTLVQPSTGQPVQP